MLRPRALVIAKDEELVLDDRAANRAAKLFPICRGKRDSWLVGKGVARLLVAAAMVEEAAAVQLVRSRFGLHSNHARGGLARFRIVVLKSYLGFGDSVKVGVHHDNAQDGVLVIRAIELEVRAREVLPIDLDLAAALRIFRGRVVETG